MAKYVEKRDPLYVEILPATRDHIAVLHHPVREGEAEDEHAVIGEIITPDGLVPVRKSDSIVDYGEKSTPRWAVIKTSEISAFFVPTGKAKAQLPSESDKS